MGRQFALVCISVFKRAECLTFISFFFSLKCFVFPRLFVRLGSSHGNVLRKHKLGMYTIQEEVEKVEEEDEKEKEEEEKEDGQGEKKEEVEGNEGRGGEERGRRVLSFPPNCLPRASAAISLTTPGRSRQSQPAPSATVLTIYRAHCLI